MSKGIVQCGHCFMAGRPQDLIVLVEIEDSILEVQCKTCSAHLLCFGVEGEEENERRVLDS